MALECFEWPWWAIDSFELCQIIIHLNASYFGVEYEMQYADFANMYASICAVNLWLAMPLLRFTLFDAFTNLWMLGSSINKLFNIIQHKFNINWLKEYTIYIYIYIYWRRQENNVNSGICIFLNVTYEQEENEKV